jgi:hypothetical protein
METLVAMAGGAEHEQCELHSALVCEAELNKR